MKRQVTPGISLGEKLCIGCGLCCTGYLFTYAGLQDEEIPGAYSLGLPVDSMEKPGERYFELPCPLWNGKCPVYADARKPNVCGVYKCNVLKRLEGGEITFEKAQETVKITKSMIADFKKRLPEEQNRNFCMELLPYLDALERAGIRCDAEGDQYLLQAGILLAQYSRQFGVSQLFTNRRKYLSSQ